MEGHEDERNRREPDGKGEQRDEEKQNGKIEVSKTGEERVA